ncbi:hypothetical protein MNR01_04355 [Lysobacter sp. S4-A87]|uniref:hypothetical protein n=1 Tax=Lysobacter sp. S4-A87 TaxID=2925843 RepID=UPI001F52F119|nr:hypothetical protein [Lysobacter sp. S4-A87]UNK50273.1 hypothetical protein MNR01_04355 [Lysobacter sp. S4-A87]
MKKTLLFLALSCVSIAASATEANGLGYSHVELDYIYNDSPLRDYKGPGFSGSFELGNGFFATGSYSRQKINHFGGHNDLSEWSLGGGYAMALSENLDWVSQAAYVEQDANLSLGQFQIAGTPDRIGEDVSGFRLSSGVRGRIAPKLIGHAYLGYQDLGNIRNQLGSFKFDGDVFADLGLEYHFTDRWAATTRVNLSEGVSEYTAGVRLSF